MHRNLIRLLIILGLVALPVCSLAQVQHPPVIAQAQEAQTSTEFAAVATSLGPQAVKVVLKHFTINPQRLDPNTHQPLRTDGSWSINKSRPESCPEAARTCVEVFYVVPDQSARCSWITSLDESGADGVVLDVNEDADNYMVRVLSGSEAAPFIRSRIKPVFPPIARAARVSGSVITKVLVGRSGEVQLVRPVSGPAMLVPASIDAAKKWSFTPMTIGARTFQYEVQLVFTFDAQFGMVKIAP